jgi:hypothetical protein
MISNLAVVVLLLVRVKIALLSPGPGMLLAIRGSVQFTLVLRALCFPKTRNLAFVSEVME